MPDSNPYQATSDVGPTASQQKPQKNRWWLGFALGAIPPALLGCYGYYNFQLYVASLPPGSAVCGNPAIESILLVVFVSPICGALCGMITKILP